MRWGPFTFYDPVFLCTALYILLLWDAGGWLRLGLLAAALHELGHAAAFFAMKHRLPRIAVTATGFCLRTRGEAFSRRQLFWLAASGPLANLFWAAVWQGKMRVEGFTVRGSAFWAAHVLTAAFNLLPIPPLDGAQLLACLAPKSRLHLPGK